MADKRKHMRTALKARVKLFLDGREEIKLTMEDMSNGGLFVLTEGMEPPELGSLVKVQLQGMIDDAPIITARVVRVTSEGIGLEFTE
jgi:c-di-GMP-binding flagellar brake protein YcgR